MVMRNQCVRRVPVRLWPCISCVRGCELRLARVLTPVVPLLWPPVDNLGLSSVPVVRSTCVCYVPGAVSPAARNHVVLDSVWFPHVSCGLLRFVLFRRSLSGSYQSLFEVSVVALPSPPGPGPYAILVVYVHGVAWWYGCLSSV